MSSTTPTPMPTPTAKRRRLNDATATLTKPFKSPLRRAPPPPTIPTQSSAPAAAKPTPESLTLQNTQRDLQSHLTLLRSDLDTIQQAYRIESSGRDTELERLIVKWRGVGQKVAEEVFEGARERVGRMGGVRGLNRRERSWGWDVEGDGDGDGGYEGAGGEKEEEEDVREDEDEEFTMEMMLTMMGIDLKVIGFDREGQRWV
ncbi:putative DNA repair protein Dds20/Mei5 [Aspergillus ibericus CBS 121593]|uniref:Swi5-domain-containing protein n=1 Tax=Aspergillus ibericus CBS 121593 TaxID=1448316 RepID=A0A395HCT2_9EURO|nr:hypothetical protein BO80DRAFT_461165 [Aspergillus ibericus CBS 121593]RAL05279.1 hypothetical protein BO80DRAFT_461165 [Aspergillus ibericus CBS 121593]